MVVLKEEAIVNTFLEHYGDSYSNGVQDVAESPMSRTWSDIANSCICSINRFNNDPMYAGQDLNKNAQLQKQYDAIITKAFNDRLTSIGVMPMNKIDKGAFLYSFDRKAQRMIPLPVVVAHENESYDFPEFLVNLDESGFIVGIKAVQPKDATGDMWQSDLDEDIFIAEFIEHHGVKGQRWGVRRERQHFYNQIESSLPHIYNDAAKAMNPHVKRINNKPEYKNMDFTKKSPTRQKYYNEFATTFAGELDNAMIKRVGETSAKGNWQAQFLVDRTNGQPYLRVFHKKQPLLVAQHDSGNSSIEDFRIEVKLSQTGHIIGFSIPDNILAQSDFITDYISHHGVKGMRWGIRNRRKGPKFGSSKDAKRTKQSLSKAKSSSVSSLTNKELKELTQRMELERKYRNGLPKSPVERGHKHVKGILTAVGITSVASLLTFKESQVGKRIMEYQKTPAGKHYPKVPVKRFGKHGIAVAKTLTNKA